MSEVVTVRGDDFMAAAQHDGTVINACLEGSADYAALDALEMLLDRIHAEADRLGVTETVESEDASLAETQPTCAPVLCGRAHHRHRTAMTRHSTSTRMIPACGHD